MELVCRVGIGEFHVLSTLVMHRSVPVACFWHVFLDSFFPLVNKICVFKSHPILQASQKTRGLLSHLIP